jgi:hypothetical protein
MRAGASKLIIATMFRPTVRACRQVGTGSARANRRLDRACVPCIIRRTLQACVVRTHHETLTDIRPDIQQTVTDVAQYLQNLGTAYPGDLWETRGSYVAIGEMLASARQKKRSRASQP